MRPHLAYVWHPLHCRWHRIHSITPHHSIYDVISTSGMTSHRCIRHCTHCIFVIASSPLISHPLLNDNTPTYSVTSYALYRSSHPILMSSHYCTYDIKTSTYVTTSSMYGNIYTIHETSQPLSVSSHPLYRQHHTHSLYDITLAMCVASVALYKTSHPHFMTSDHRVFLITPTILDSCPLYLCHHLHCTDDITPTVSLRSHPL